jgi:hypothetical protein
MGDGRRTQPRDDTGVGAALAPGVLLGVLVAVLLAVPLALLGGPGAAAAEEVEPAVPTVTVTQAPPTVTPTPPAPAPTVTATAPGPTVTATLPQPTVTVTRTVAPPRPTATATVPSATVRVTVRAPAQAAPEPAPAGRDGTAREHRPGGEARLPVAPAGPAVGPSLAPVLPETVSNSTSPRDALTAMAAGALLALVAAGGVLAGVRSVVYLRMSRRPGARSGRRPSRWPVRRPNYGTRAR